MYGTPSSPTKGAWGIESDSTSWGFSGIFFKLSAVKLYFAVVLTCVLAFVLGEVSTVGLAAAGLGFSFWANLFFLIPRPTH